MTTIAWDGKTLAADQCSWHRGTRRKVCKVLHLKESKWGEVLIACAGDAALSYEILHWAQGGSPAPDHKRFGVDPDAICAVIISKTCGIVELSATLTEMPINENIYATGAGQEFAWGALEAGATARQAVEIAMKRSDYAALGVDCVSFDKPHESI